MSVTAYRSSRRDFGRRPKLLPVGRSRNLAILVCLILILLAILVSPALSEATTTVRVVIETVQALDDFDGPFFFDRADFFPRVEIDGQSFGSNLLVFSNQDWITPNWQFSRQVALSRVTIPISIAIWDSDSGEQEADVTPGGDARIDLTVDLSPCAITGDVSGACWVTLKSQGSSAPRAVVWFRVEIGDPPPMVRVTLTIERVRAIAEFDGPFSFDRADFFPIVGIAGSEIFGGNLTISNQDDITPNWQFTKEVPLALGSIPVFIEIWEADDFGNRQFVDVSPVAGRRLDLTVALNPCSVGGEVSGGCSVSLGSTGDESLNAELRFRIEVEPTPSMSGFNIRCLHQPLWPQSGQSITIMAEALTDNLARLPSTVGVTMEIWVDDQVAPDSTNTNADTHTFTFTPAPMATQVVYGCAAKSTAINIWSGWHATQIGQPTATRAVPVVFTRSVGSAIDIVFIPDRDSYTDANDPDFINDARNAILQSFYGDRYFLRNQRTFNFWLAQDMGDYEELCNHSVPSNWDSDYAFAESGSIIHTDALRDCASFGSRIFSGEVGDWRVFLHEAGHQPFGLADEYCCDGWNAQVSPFPNVYGSLAACQADAVNVGRTPSDCRTWTSNSGIWYTSDPATPDLMVDNLTPQALDIRRIGWILVNCEGGAC